MTATEATTKAATTTTTTAAADSITKSQTETTTKTATETTTESTTACTHASSNKDKSTTSYKIKNLKKGRKYYVKIRAYKTIKVDSKTAKNYGGYSSVKSIKCK